MDAVRVFLVDRPDVAARLAPVVVHVRVLTHVVLPSRGWLVTNGTGSVGTGANHMSPPEPLRRSGLGLRNGVTCRTLEGSALFTAHR